MTIKSCIFYHNNLRANHQTQIIPMKMICICNKIPSTADGMHAITWHLSSKPTTLMSLKPRLSQVCSPAIGTKCILVQYNYHLKQTKSMTYHGKKVKAHDMEKMQQMYVITYLICIQYEIRKNIVSSHQKSDP